MDKEHVVFASMSMSAWMYMREREIQRRDEMYTQNNLLDQFKRKQNNISNQPYMNHNRESVSVCVRARENSNCKTCIQDWNERQREYEKTWKIKACVRVQRFVATEFQFSWSCNFVQTLHRCENAVGLTFKIQEISIIWRKN